MRCGWIAIVLLGALVGCGDDEVHFHELSDSLGFRFAMETQGADVDFFHPVEDPLPCNDARPGWSYRWNRIIELCTVCFDDDGTYGWSPVSDCRPVICDEQTECPRIRDDEFECVRGLCQDIARVDEPTIGRFTAPTLCAADVPRFRPSASAERPVLEARLDAMSCDDEQNTCDLPLPDGCMQP